MSLKSIRYALRKQVNIMDVINYYGIDVKHKKAICPFHNDTNPSMAIDPNKNIYKCFVCGHGGDSFKFVKEYENIVNKNIDFNETDAIRKVAEICNIDLTNYNLDTSNEIEERYTSEQKEIIKTNEEVNRVFNYLLTRTEGGRTTKEYLSNRGINEETIEYFSLGLAPREDILSVKENPDYVAAKLITEKSHDYFRNRLMIPIYDDQNNVVGFSGRTLDKNEQIKYLNSPETLTFQKSNLLFNLNNARLSALEKKELIITEGYFEPMALHQIGIDNDVSLMGTALTKEHISIFRKLNVRVNLMLDNDQAGRNAMLKNINLLRQAGIDVVVTDLSKFTEYKDIDEVIMNTSYDKIDQLKQDLKQAKLSGFQYMLQEYCKEHLSKNVTMLEIQDMYTQFIKEIKTPIERAVFIKVMSEYTDFSNDQILQIFNEDDKEQLDYYKDKIFTENIERELTELSRLTDDINLKLYILENKDKLTNTLFNYLRSHFQDYFQDDLVDYKKLIKDTIIESNSYKNYCDLNNTLYKHLLDRSIYNNGENGVLVHYTSNEAIKVIDKLKHTDLKDVDELLLINKFDDIYKLLPTGLISPIIFREIQMAIFTNKSVRFDFNTMFDNYYLQHGIMECLSEEMKVGNRLKNVVIVPNLDSDIVYSEKTKEPEKAGNELEKDIIENKEMSIENDVQECIFISKSLIKQTNQDSYLISIPKSDYFVKIPNKLIIYEKEKSMTVAIPADTAISLDYYDSNLNHLGYLNKDELGEYFNIKNINSVNRKIEKNSANQSQIKKSLKTFENITIDIKMFDQELETETHYFVRLPYHKNDFTFIEKSKSKWLKEDKTLSYDIRNIDSFKIYDCEGNPKGQMTKDALLTSFELKTAEKKNLVTVKLPKDKIRRELVGNKPYYRFETRNKSGMIFIHLPQDILKSESSNEFIFKAHRDFKLEFQGNNGTGVITLGYVANKTKTKTDKDIEKW